MLYGPMIVSTPGPRIPLSYGPVRVLTFESIFIEKIDKITRGFRGRSPLAILFLSFFEKPGADAGAFAGAETDTHDVIRVHPGLLRKERGGPQAGPEKAVFFGMSAHNKRNPTERDIVCAATFFWPELQKKAEAHQATVSSRGLCPWTPVIRSVRFLREPTHRYYKKSTVNKGLRSREVWTVLGYDKRIIRGV